MKLRPTLIAALLTGCAALTSTAAPPNFIFILTDDQGCPCCLKGASGFRIL
ncbi:MAG TPA: hypothetical protein VD994_21495 [Prosthecobacter sp.]|nr:hypothetical protein [Prosthecobacter sp.]